ncbi:MAG: hypothetical protein Q4B68_01575 [Bacteroidales bacterium]|nr:hypothetical protein [Bacteroidales bacterium]
MKYSLRGSAEGDVRYSLRSAQEGLVRLMNRLDDERPSGASGSKAKFDAEQFDKENGTETKRFFAFLERGKKLLDGENKFFKVGVAGDLLNKYGMKGSITIGSSAFNSRHTKDKSHNFTKENWEDVFKNINNPIIISTYKNKEGSFRLYLVSKIGNENVCVGIDVKNNGYDNSLMNIKTAFGRDIEKAFTGVAENVIYQKEEHYFESSSAHNSLIYQNDAHSDSKGTQEVGTDQISGAENAAGGADYSLRASVDAKRDAEYEDAVKAGDLEKASRMLDDAARKAGYISTSEYRMSHRAPYKDNEGYHKSMDDVVGMYPEDVYDNDGWRHYGYGRSSNDYEAWRIITSVRNNPDAKVKVYRTVSADVKESEIRNGDWVTPVRAYAEQHRGNIGGRTRIIEQEVRAGDLYTDGNDLCEWGYDDGKPYVYKNTKNGRKLLEPTYDDNGNLIPLSKRFNQRNKDNRFSLRGGSDGGGVAERYAQASAKKEPRRVGWNEVKQAEAVSLEDFVQRQLAAGGLKVKWNDNDNGSKGLGAHTHVRAYAC